MYRVDASCRRKFPGQGRVPTLDLSDQGDWNLEARGAPEHHTESVSVMLLLLHTAIPKYTSTVRADVC